MESAKQLAKRFRELFLNGTWIANTNYKDLLDTIDWQEANQKVGSLNTISVLTFHINYYVEGVLEVFESGELTIRDKYSFNAPKLNSEVDWEVLKNRLFRNSQSVSDHIETMTEGQLSLIKKMVSTKNKE